MTRGSVDIHLRSASPQDREFLYDLHCRTMRDVIERTWGWDDAWQREDFDRRFCEYVWSIIECDERPAGGLLVEAMADSLYIHELQLLPEYQNRGIGTAVVQRVIDEAAGRGFPVTLSVVQANPRAKQLYERLGFEVTEFDAPFFRMRHNARLRERV
jgi:ribosomal protein S18 acetylase RimI-like enzyme